MAYLVDRWEDETRRGKGKRWQVKWKVGVERRSEQFSRKSDAEDFMLELERSLRRGEFLDPQRGRMTLGEFAPKWFAARAPLVKPMTARDYDSLLRTLILPCFGSVPLLQVGFTEVGEWVGEMKARGLSASRIRQAHFVLRSIMDFAVLDRRLVKHDVDAVKVPKLPGRRRHRYLTHEQLQVLADECGLYQPFVLTLGYVGLRWGEAIALTPGDVVDGRLLISKTLTEHGGAFIAGTPKDDEEREVVVPGIVLDAIEPLLDRPASAPLFTASRGGLIRGSNFRGHVDRQGRAHGVFVPALQRAGLPRMRIHELRHTAASLAVSSGANVLAVARMLGHSNPTETLRTYADLFDSDLEDVAAKLDAAARAARSDRLPAGVVPLR